VIGWRVRLRRIRPVPLLCLTTVWVLLWGTFSLGNVVNGLLLGAVALFLLALPDVAFGGRPHGRNLGVFVLQFARDLLVASVQVSWQALRPGPQDVSSIVAAQLRSDSELIVTLTVEALSLVPGSIVIEVDAPRRTLYAHVLSAPNNAAVEAFRRRVLEVEAGIIRALGKDHDLALLEAAHRRREKP
jgi:multicomponent Na+:H+ antiporter subunit E